MTDLSRATSSAMSLLDLAIGASFALLGGSSKTVDRRRHASGRFSRRRRIVSGVMVFCLKTFWRQWVTHGQIWGNSASNTRRKS
jgi:hypothetical protein